MDKIEARTHRSEMPGLWAMEIRGPATSEGDHRYLCRAPCETVAAAQAGRIAGALRGSWGFDMYWIDPSQLLNARVHLPDEEGHCDVLDRGEWVQLMAAHEASEWAAPDRASLD